MMDIVIALTALVVGLGIGWFLASRPLAEWKARHAERDTEAKVLDGKFREAIVNLAAESERARKAGELAAELAQVREDREALRTELATLKANEANFAEQQRLLLESQALLKKEFENAGSKVLERAQEVFLSRAGERFAEAEATNAERIRTLLAPVGERLKSYEEQIASLEKQRVDAFGQLAGVIEGLRAGQEAVRREALRLGESLRNAPKVRGQWGEMSLKNILLQCGLSEYADFDTEVSVNGDEGRLRPDAVVRIPGQKSLIIDAKVSLNAYQEAFDAEEGDARRLAFVAHAKAIRAHMQGLSTKAYHSQFQESPDYVIMYVPGEHFMAAALEHDAKLWEDAFKSRVLLATPTNLVAIARTVAMVWTQDTLANEAREIGRLGTEIYERIRTAGEHLKGVGAGLERAVRKYNDFVGSFERNVMSSGRKLRDKGIEIGKREIEDVPLVETTPRHGSGAGEPPALEFDEDAAEPLVPAEDEAASR